MYAGRTYNSGMTTYADARTDSVSKGPAAIVVKLLCHVSQLRPGADSCLPGCLVDSDGLEVDHVDDHLSGDSAEA